MNFIEHWFKGLPEDARALVWTLPDKKSTWYLSGEAIQTRVANNFYKNGDTYFGVGFAPDGLSQKQRCSARDIVGIPGLWADIDYQGDAHKNKTLPPDEEHAMMILDDVWIKPSHVIHSGHGIQAYWLFDNPWIFKDAADRQRAAELSERWNKLLARNAEQHGWTIDSVFDLARIMRLPGTFNHKSDPVLVRVIQEAQERHKVSDFVTVVDNAGITVKTRSVASVKTVNGTFELDGKAQPDPVLFAELCKREQLFEQSFKRMRGDMDDRSPSSYDMSLATYAANAGWNDQQIVDLLVAGRRQAGENLKLRPDYYARTISKARQKTNLSEVATKIQDIESAAATDEEAREKKFDFVSGALGLKLTKVIKYVSDESHYTLEVDGKQVILGSIDNLMGLMAFKRKIADHTGLIIAVKPAEWKEIAQAILDLREDQDMGAESRAAEFVELHIDSYLASQTILDGPEEANRRKAPFKHEGGIWIFSTNFVQWLLAFASVRLSVKELTIRLSYYGAEPKKIHVKYKGRRTMIKVWRVSDVSEGG